VIARRFISRLHHIRVRNKVRPQQRTPDTKANPATMAAGMIERMAPIANNNGPTTATNPAMITIVCFVPESLEMQPLFIDRRDQEQW
jgi:hypothetical protein